MGHVDNEVAFAFELFGKMFEIRWYAIFVTGGMIMALLLLIYLIKRKKDEYIIDDALEIFLFAIPFAIIFARIGYALPRIDTFNSVFEFFDITQGGLTIVAGVPGGALGLLIYCKIRKKSPFRLFDTIVPCLLLGQVVGRWGNFFNQELYGFKITNEAFQHFPFAVYIDKYHVGLGETEGWYCANFFYEGALNFIACIVVLVLIFKFSKRLKVGTLTVGYVVWYGLVRGILEFIKVGQMTVGGIRVVQLVCFIAAAIGLVLLILVQKGIIKLETEKMKKNHFIHSSIEDDIMSNNNKYNIVKEVYIMDASDLSDMNEDSNE